jgi:hypothetical protein
VSPVDPRSESLLERSSPFFHLANLCTQSTHVQDLTIEADAEQVTDAAYINDDDALEIARQCVAIGAEFTILPGSLIHSLHDPCPHPPPQPSETLHCSMHCKVHGRAAGQPCPVESQVTCSAEFSKPRCHDPR